MTSKCAAAEAASESVDVRNSGENQAGDDGGNAANASSGLQERMAADIAELRTLVMAAAKHFNIETPSTKERPSTQQDDVDFESIKPKNESYDEETTIKRHIAFLPHESMLNGTADWKYLFEMDAPAVKANIWPRNWSEATEGLQVVLEWSLPRQSDISNKITEFGYTADGYPCDLSNSFFHGVFGERTYISSKSSPPTPPWAGQRFGKEWTIYLYRESDTSSLAVALCQLLDNTENTASGDNRNDWALINGQKTQHQHLQMFINIYKGSWDFKSLHWHPLLKLMQDPDKSESRSLIFQHHMRFLNASPFHRPPFPILQRKSGWVRTLAESGRLAVSEGRIAVAVRTTCDLDLAVFSLLLLVDNGGQRYRFTNAKGPGELGSARQWLQAGIRPAIRSTGISAFAFRIRSLCSAWAEEWEQTLDCFDEELEVQVTDILARKRRLQLMYDDSNLAVSELYFFISQLLRFASVWIRESVDDLHDFVRKLEDHHFSPANKTRHPHASFLPDTPEAQRAAIEVFRQNWASVTTHQQKLADILLDRIAKKQEEVNSLREGIFTATAVSEATKSKQLNHYILVFTVVTIFYLPLSFVAALYALELFSWDDPNQKTSFVVTLVLVAGTTYCFAGYLIWFVREPERRQMFKKTRKRAKSIGRLFKRRKRWDGSDLDSDSDD